MQEAFVAALLAVARRMRFSLGEIDDLMEEMGDGWIGVIDSEKDDLSKNMLWREIRKQVDILRDGMEEKKM